MNPAIRLAYLHNVGDVAVTLGLVAAGVLVGVTGFPIVDSLIAGWIVWTTPQEVVHQGQALQWSKEAVCVHEPGEIGVHACTHLPPVCRYL